jgi:hypothetical protein
MTEQLYPSFPEVENNAARLIDEPEVPDYATWSSQNELGDDEIENRVRYADSVRKSYITHGSYSDSRQAAGIERDITNGLVGSLIEDGEVDPQDEETINSLVAPRDRSFEDKLSFVRAYTTSKDESWNVGTQYFAHQKALQKGDPEDFENPIIQERTASLKAEAEEVLKGGAYEKALRKAVDSGELSMAVLPDSEGDPSIYTGPSMSGMSFSDAVDQAVSMGNMSYSQAAAAARKYDKPEGYDIPLYQIEEYQKDQKIIGALANSDGNFKMLTQRLAGHYDIYDKDEVDRTPTEKEEKLGQLTQDLYSTLLSTNVFEQGEEPSYESFKEVMTLMSRSQNFHQEKAIDADDDNVADNIRKIGFAPLQMRSSAMLNKNIFQATIAANPQLTDAQVKQFENQREEQLINAFPDNNKLLEDSSIREEWMTYRQRGLAAGQKNYEILDAFVSDPDNYDVLDESMGGVWASVKEGISTSVGAVQLATGSMTGSEDLQAKGRETLLEDMETASNRRNLAMLMGEEYGFTRSIAEGIAPVVVDMAATALLTAATAPAFGAGGALYLAAKTAATTGARLTAKGFAKGLVTSTLRAGSKEGLELVAEKASLEGLIKESADTVAERGVMDVVKSYNSVMTKSMGASRMSGVMLPAMNRSGGSTYASIYSQLGQDNPEMSHAEKHDKALGGGLTASAFTGLLVGGFSKLGIPLLDNALATGATGRQISKIISPLLNRGGEELTEGTFKQLATKVMTDMTKSHSGFTNFLKSSAAGAAGEAPEETLDSFINGLVEDAYTDKDRPFLERMQQSFMAGLHGAALGFGMPAATYVAGATNANRRLKEEAPNVLRDFRSNLTQKLNETGSPLTEEVVGNLLLSSAQDQEAFILNRTNRIQEVRALQADVKEAGKARSFEMEERVSDTTTFEFSDVDDLIPEGTTLSSMSEDQKNTYYSLSAVREQLMQPDLPEIETGFEGDQMVFDATETIVPRTKLEFATGGTTIEVGTPLRDLDVEQYERYNAISNLAAKTVGVAPPTIPTFDDLQATKAIPSPSEAFPKPSPEGALPEPEVADQIPAPSRVSELKANTYIPNPIEGPSETVTNATVREIEVYKDQLKILELKKNNQQQELTSDEAKRGELTTTIEDLRSEISLVEEVGQEAKNAKEKLRNVKTLQRLNKQLKQYEDQLQQITDSGATGASQFDPEIETLEARIASAQETLEGVKMGGQDPDTKLDASTIRQIEVYKDQIKLLQMYENTEQGISEDQAKQIEQLEIKIQEAEASLGLAVKPSEHLVVRVQNSGEALRTLYPTLAREYGELLNDYSTIRQSEFSQEEGVLPKTLGRASKVVTMMDGNGELYYMLGSANTPLSEMKIVRQTEARQQQETLPLFAERPVVSFPHSNLKSVVRGSSLEAIEDADQLRLLEQAALKNMGVAGISDRKTRPVEPSLSKPKAGTTEIYQEYGAPYRQDDTEVEATPTTRKRKETFDAVNFLRNPVQEGIRMTPTQLELGKAWYGTAKQEDKVPELLVSGKKIQDVAFMLNNAITTGKVETESAPEEVSKYSPEAAAQLSYVTEKLRSMNEPTWVEQQVTEANKGMDRDRADIIMQRAAARPDTSSPRQELSAEEMQDIARRAELGFIDDPEKWNMYTRQWEDNRVISPDLYLSPDEDQLNAIRGELSEESLKSLVPLETIDIKRIPAYKQGLVKTAEELQSKQIQVLRDLIYQGYPVTINTGSGNMVGVLPQSEAKEGGFNTLVELPKGAKRYHIYFTQAIAERINAIYPTIDLTQYEVKRKESKEELRVKAQKKLGRSRYIEFRPRNDSATGQVALGSATYSKQPKVSMWTPSMARKIADEMQAVLKAKPKRYRADVRKNIEAQISNLRKQVKTARPPLQVDLTKGIHTQRSATKTSYHRINEDGTVSRFQNAKLNLYVDGDGMGVFNNDPVLVGEMISNNIPVRIPKEILENTGDNKDTLARQQINPSIKYDNRGNVYRVVRPTADGKGIETVAHESRRTITMPDLGVGETTAEAQQMFNPSAMADILVTPPSEDKASGMDLSNNFVIREGSKKQVKLGELQSNFISWSAAASKPTRNRQSKYLNNISGVGRNDGRGVSASEYDFFVTSFNIEYQFLLTLHGVRKELKPYITQGEGGNPVLAQTNEDKALKRFMELVDSDMETTARTLGKRMGIARDSYDPVKNISKAERDQLHKDTILNFIRSSVVNNSKLKAGTMPTMKDVSNTIVSRVKTNRASTFGVDVLAGAVELQAMDPEVADILLYNESVGRNDLPSAETNAEYKDPDDYNNLEEQVKAIPEANPLTYEQREDLSMMFLDDAFTNTIDQAIEAIQTPDNRDAFIDLLRRTIHLGSARPNEDYNVKDFPRYWHHLSSSLVSATNEHAAEMMTFIKGLKLDSTAAQVDLRSNLKMILFPQDVTDTQLAKFHPTLMRWKVSNSMETSRAILNDISFALRSVYAMTAITQEQRPQALAQNRAEAERLGLEDNNSSSVVEAINKIRNESESDQHRLVAELLLEDPAFISSVKFNMGEGTDVVPARYDRLSDGSHAVHINLAGHNGRGLENVLLEEYVHAFLSDVINKPSSELTPTQRQAMQRLRGLMSIAKKQFDAETSNNPDIVEKSISYGFSNMDDFAASFLLNPDFQAYIKSIETPTTQRGLFKRIIDSIVGMFQRAIGSKKLTKEEAVSFSEAMEDLVDLTRSRASDVRPDLRTSLAHALGEAAKDSRAAADSTKFLRQLNTESDAPVTPPSEQELRLAEKEEQRDEANRTALQEETIKADSAFSQVPVSNLGAQSSMEVEQLQDYVINEALPFLRASTPPELRMIVDTTLSNQDGNPVAAASRGNVVYVNPYGIANMIAGIEGDGKNNIRSIQHSLLSVLSEEVGHYGAFNTFTLAEIDDMGKQLGREELGAVASTYYRTQEALDGALARLDSSDPDISNGEIRNLVDEHLRMQGQRAMRGFITEEDLAFYRTNPSALATLKRYIQGYLRTLAIKFKSFRNKDFMVGRVNRLVAELRQIDAGYRPMQATQVFDPNNPDMAFAVMDAVTNETMTLELERALGFMGSDGYNSEAGNPRYTSAGAGLGNQDSAYLSAVEDGDTDAAQQMVDDAAMRAGYVEDMYHGTVSKKNFNKFRQKQSGIWLAFDESDARPSVQDASRVMPMKVDLGGFPVVLSAQDYADWQSSANPMKWIADFRNFKWRQGDYEQFNTQGLIAPSSVRVGDYATVVFNSNQLKSGEAITKTSTGEVIPLSERFDTATGDIRYTSAGNATADLLLDFKHVPTKFELPMMHAGEYIKPSIAKRLFLSDADVRATRLYKDMRDHHRGSAETLTRMHNEFINIQKKDYGKDRSQWPSEDIAKAVGSTDSPDIPEATSQRIEDAYDAKIREIKANKNLSEEQSKSQIIAANELRQQRRSTAMRARTQSVRVEQEAAINRINQQSPALATHITKMRGLVDQLSALLPKYYKLKDQDGVATTLGIKIDANQGIYITRTYKMFTEVGYHKTIRDQMVDPQTENYRQLKDRALGLFDELKLEQMTKVEAEKLQDADPEMSKERAEELGEERAKIWMDANPESSANALLDFIDSYHNPVNSDAIRNSDGYKVLVDNLKQRKSDEDLPKVLREVLGENTNLEDGVINLLNTYSTVASMVTNQAFLFNMATVGQGKHVKEGVPLEDKFLMTQEEYDQALAEDKEKYNEWQQDKSRVSIHDPLRGLYGPPEFWEDLRVMTNRGQNQAPQGEAERRMQQISSGVASATGAAMAMKTLGSAGFYIRNALGNPLFFAPMQGNFNHWEMTKLAVDQFKRTVTTLEDTDTELQKYYDLGILGTTLRTNIMRDLMVGKTRISDVRTTLQDIESKHGPIDEIKSKLDKAKGAGGKVMKGLETVYRQAEQLAEAADAFYKIAYYEAEMRVLREAAAAAEPNTSYYGVSEDVLMKEAAHVVKQTSQMSSQRWPIIEKISQSPYGIAFAPFLGFIGDTFRIPVNTFIQAKKERGSDNAVIRRRGTRRFFGMGLVTIASATLPRLVASMFSDLEEEDRYMLRKSFPDFAKRSNPMYFNINGVLKRASLTFINPFSPIADPFVSSWGELTRGNYAKAASNIVTGLVMDTFGNEQILFGTAMQLKRNRDEATGRPIYDEEVDEPMEVVGKQIAFLLRGAYEPRTMLAIREGFEKYGLEPEGFATGITGRVLEEFLPAKWSDVELDQSYRSYLYKLKDSASEARRETFKIQQREPMSSDSIASLYTDNYDAMHRINSKLYSAMNAYERMGIPRWQLQNTAIKAGYGKRRINNISSGYMEAPSISPSLMSDLAAKGLTNRASPFFGARLSSPPMRLLDPDQ